MRIDQGQACKPHDIIATELAPHPYQMPDSFRGPEPMPMAPQLFMRPGAPRMVNNGDSNSGAFKVLQMYPDLYVDFDIQRRRIAAEYNRICREIRHAINNTMADVSIKKRECQIHTTVARQKFQNLEQKTFERYLKKAVKSSNRSLGVSNKRLEKKHMKQKRKKRRENFQPEQVLILRTWLLSHLKHPYPTPQEKEELAQRASLTYDQVSNWFVNARMRTCRPVMKRFEKNVPVNENRDKMGLVFNSDGIVLSDQAISEVIKMEKSPNLRKRAMTQVLKADTDEPGLIQHMHPTIKEDSIPSIKQDYDSQMPAADDCFDLNVNDLGNLVSIAEAGNVDQKLPLDSILPPPGVPLVTGRMISAMA